MTHLEWVDHPAGEAVGGGSLCRILQERGVSVQEEGRTKGLWDKKGQSVGDVEERLQGYNMRLGITQCLGSALVYADPDIALLFSTDSYPVFFNVDSDIKSRYLQKYEQKNKL